MTKKSVKIDYSIFVNSSGIKAPLIAISVLEVEAAEQNIRNEFRNRGEPIDPPTYKVEVAGGGEQTFPLTADNLVVENNDQETLRRKMDWLAYQNANDRMNNEINKVRTALILEGIDIKELPEDGKWVARCKRLGIHLPEDHDELMDFYKKSVIMRSPEDIARVELQIMLLSTGKTYTPEEMAAVEGKFLDIFYKGLEGPNQVDKPKRSKKGITRQ